ncbi:MAG TPA: O-antigen polymerase [Terracidiphilus sp.]|nr:O-antigen polymerase [Terracidiphilus sp.]
MLITLSLQITYVSYPDLWLPVGLFTLSSFAMLGGYYATKLLLRRDTVAEREPTNFLLDTRRLTRLNLAFCAVAMMIILFNWVKEGPPPAIGDPTSYLTYGRFRQVLFPLLTVITVNAFLDRSRLRKLLFAGFGMFWLAIYITRGLMVLTFLEVFFVVVLTSKMSRRKLYALSLAGVAIVVTGATLIGNIRTAHAVFLAFLQIRQKYVDWPMASLWLTSYISIPLSNLCWMLKTIPYHGPTLAFIYPLLPSFIAPVDPHLAIHSDLRIIDGASTYLANYVLDFSYLGAYIPNILIGSASAWVMERGLPRQFLVAIIFLTCISFICFSDMFAPLSTIIQVLIQSMVQRKCFRWEPATSGEV